MKLVLDFNRLRKDWKRKKSSPYQSGQTNWPWNDGLNRVAIYHCIVRMVQKGPLVREGGSRGQNTILTSLLSKAERCNNLRKTMLSHN